MSILREIRQRIRHVAAALLFASLTAYFGYHAVQGERGLLAWLALTARIETARIVLAEVGAERDEWRHRVSLLRPQSLDLDLLDERARAVLGLGQAGEIVHLEPRVSIAPRP